MEVVKTDVDRERNLLIGLIVSTEFLEQMQAIIDVSLLENRGSKWIVEKCIDFYSRYEESPGKEIQDIYESNADRMNPDESEYVSKLLYSLSAQAARYENFNVLYYADESEKFLKSKKLLKLVRQIQGDISDGDVNRAENRIPSFKRLGRSKGEATNVFDPEVAKKSLNLVNESSILEFSGPLGKLVGPMFRGDLVSFAAPMKRGKTWWLLHTGMIGYVNGLNVLFISLEMLEHQVVSRLMSYITARPMRGNGSVGMIAMVGDKEKKSVKIEQWVEHKELLVYDEGVEKALSFMKRSNSGGDFRLLTFPQDTLNVHELEMHLENMEHYDQWVPDVIVADYADIMAPEPNASREYRHRLDATWKALRGLAQKRNILVVTATQTDRTTLRKDTHSENVSEDIRKLAHVSKLIGLNQKEYEKEKQIMRVAVLADRHAYHNSNREVVVTQALDIGKPVIESQWRTNMLAEVLSDPTTKKRR